MLTPHELDLFERLVKALERIATRSDEVTDHDKQAIRTNDVGREKVYATHLGKKLSEPEQGGR